MYDFLVSLMEMEGYVSGACRWDWEGFSRRKDIWVVDDIGRMGEWGNGWGGGGNYGVQ